MFKIRSWHHDNKFVVSFQGQELYFPVALQSLFVFNIVIETADSGKKLREAEVVDNRELKTDFNHSHKVMSYTRTYKKKGR